MSVRGNAAPRGMTARDRIRLTGPFADDYLKAEMPALMAGSVDAARDASPSLNARPALDLLVRSPGPWDRTLADAIAPGQPNIGHNGPASRNVPLPQADPQSLFVFGRASNALRVVFMLPRPAMETIEILRRTLEQMESDPRFDAESMAELRRIVVNRIAELEADRVLEPAAAQGASAVLVGGKAIPLD